MSLPDLSTAPTKCNCPLCNKLIKVTKLGLLPSHSNHKIKCPQSGLPILSPAIPRTLNVFSALALTTKQPIVTIPTSLTDVLTHPIIPTLTVTNASTFDPADSNVEIFLTTPKPFEISRIPKRARLQVARHLSKNLTSLLNNYSSVRHWLDTLSFAFITLQVPDPTSKKSLTQLNLHNWYIDNGILGGPPTEVTKAIQIIKSSEKSLGLRVNQDKSEYCPLGIIDLNHDTMFNHTPLNVLTHLGSPVGKDESFTKFFADILREI
ncbi:uncharacterized protein LOC135926030 [Gordionus sp. m RMFG-2023]|uniref:uncharacterized protein LOC135926030 n=1 Tax=Gordionus sp. m RMFG-2023 TaxID=3053472 RepID=UPI0031FC33C8